MRGTIFYRAAVAVGVVALGLSMLACANACPGAVSQFSAGCVQQVQAVQYAPIVAPVAQAYVAPVVKQFVAPPPVYAAPVFSAPVVQQYSAAHVAQVNVAPVAAVKSRTVTRTRPVRVPRRSVSVSKQIVAPAAIVAPVVGY